LVGDVSDAELVARALDGVELVYHIAAAMREANVPDSHFWKVNVEATDRLLALSRKAGVSRFLYCGTSGVVGPSEGRMTDEETECHPKDIYQTTKLAAERAVLDYGREAGLAVSVVRPAGVYGPGDGRLLKLFQMVRKGWFLLVGSGHGKHHLVYIDDLVDGMWLAASNDGAVGRCYNLAGGSPVPLRRLVDTIAGELGVTCQLVRLPFGPMRLLAVVMDRTLRPLGIQPPLYPRRLDFFRHDEHFDISRARRELGFEPRVSLAEGIARTAAAYRAEGWL
jgi:nucleoside-diphosphate-sugar epimerase